ncbi:MAG: hypothetical protein ACW96N_00320 [Candidatus Thorarchaeota archaeon]|jgi:tRNA-binding EMAP/Myf-like protein
MIEAMIVEDVKTHPKINSLNICTLSNGVECLQVVTESIHSYKVNDMVAVARIGTVLPADYGSGDNPLLVMKKRVCGVYSEGLALGVTNGGLGSDVSRAYGAIDTN